VEDRISRSARPPKILDCLPDSNCYCTQEAAIPGTCVQYPDLQGGGALGDALTPGTPAGSMAASAHGGTYSHVAVVGGA